jgi:hypothetical protein
MDPRTLQIMQSFAWALGVLLLIALSAWAVLAVRRRTIVAEAPTLPAGSTGPTDWVGLLTAMQADRIPAKSWLALGTTLAAQASACPPPLRAPLIAAFDAAIARCRDPLASASMTQVRRALAAPPAA